MPGWLLDPWPWYVTGPLVGLVVPLLLWAGGEFGVSENLRHVCAAVFPARADLFRYDWKSRGLWNLMFALGIVLGGALAATVLSDPGATVAISAATVRDLQALGVHTFDGLAPAQVFSGDGLLTPQGLVILVGGGFLVGFGTRYAGGCTSGHSISGLANLQLPSLVATAAFFAGGVAITWLVLPLVF
jgi:uncharacterized membrane protein YedE/YeeE